MAAPSRARLDSCRRRVNADGTGPSAVDGEVSPCSPEQHGRQRRSIPIGQLTTWAEGVEDVDHRLARGVVAKAAVAFDDGQILFERLVIAAAGGEDLCQQE